jgi:hypothetical protein
MVKKFIGYILACVGLIGLGLSSPAGKKFAPFMESVDQKSVLIGSLIFVVAGLIIVGVFGNGGKGKQSDKEVPIYKGKKIVGYRVEK